MVGTLRVSYEGVWLLLVCFVGLQLNRHYLLQVGVVGTLLMLAKLLGCSSSVQVSRLPVLLQSVCLPAA
jgi:hypothetical protein